MIRSTVLTSLLVFHTLAAQAQTRPATYAELTQRLKAADALSSHVEVISIGKSVEGRDIWAAKLIPFDYPKPVEQKFPQFFFARQHGDEPAGQEALLELVEDVASDKTGLRYWTYVVPCVNPDGAERNQRRNAANADLNRDHQTLEQPEIQALHKFFREIKPVVAVDCHEFARDSSDYVKRGYVEWPLIMLDSANQPAWRNPTKGFSSIEDRMQELGYEFTRYFLGAVDRHEECRHSTLEADDARNAFGLYGSSSFIIESGQYRSAANPYADLPRRVGAYRALLDQLRADYYYSASKFHPIPSYVITNRLYVSALDMVENGVIMRSDKGNFPTQKVRSIATSEVVTLRAPNFMTKVANKAFVETPSGYIIPAQHASVFKTLLDRHGLSYETTGGKLLAERVKLLKYEPDEDPINNRYGGRVHTVRDPAELIEFPVGSLLVPIPPNYDGTRTIVLLEPLMVYGLYQYDKYRKLVGADKVVPVYRIPATKP